MRKSVKPSLLQHCVFGVVAALFALLVAQRIWRYTTFDSPRREMPLPVAEAEEQEVFRSPLGKYSLSDIAANRNQLPSQQYRGFRATHDFSPRPGDRLCPITRTKANANCTWIVAGEKYQFCCPPCIVEFVRMARDEPDRIRPPGEYIAP